MRATLEAIFETRSGVTLDYPRCLERNEKTSGAYFTEITGHVLKPPFKSAPAGPSNKLTHTKRQDVVRLIEELEEASGLKPWRNNSGTRGADGDFIRTNLDFGSPRYL
ncbi:hypothetical protein KM043_010048 [Ampulex compressa]|nr:hypothetical protein KM043_010048 [Ampulex compressa]